MTSLLPGDIIVQPNCVKFRPNPNPNPDLGVFAGSQDLMC